MGELNRDLGFKADSPNFKSKIPYLMFVLVAVGLVLFLLSLNSIFNNTNYSTDSSSSNEKSVVSITISNVGDSLSAFAQSLYARVTGFVSEGESSESSSSESSTPSDSAPAETSAPTETPAAETIETPTETPTETPATETPATETPLEDEIPLEPPLPPMPEPTPETPTEEPANETPAEELTTNETETPAEENQTEIPTQTPVEIINETESSSGGEIPSEVINETYVLPSEENVTEVVLNETLIIANETITEEANVTEGNLTLQTTTKQYGAVLGKPVKWEKRIKVETDSGESSNEIINVELPASAGSVSVVKVDSETGEQTDITDDSAKVDITNEKVVEEKDVVSITGNIISEESGMGILTSLFNSLERFFNSLFVFTGRGVEDIPSGEENVSVSVSDQVSNNDEIVVEYYTEAPYAKETIIGDKKEIIIVGPDNVHYKDILAFSELPSEVLNESSIIFYWINDTSGERQVAEFVAKDSDGNGMLDTIEWVVPHLSEQTYEIIFITKAFHLDSNKNLISDIYDSVKSKDGNWSEVINDGEYVRVSFEVPLDNTRDITLYARSADSSFASMEIYAENSSDLIATSESIVSEGTYKTLLIGMSGSSLVFDLKAVGNLELDYIVDPTCPNGMVGSGTEGDPCQILNWTNLNATRDQLSYSYKLMNDLSSASSDYTGFGNNWQPVGDEGAGVVTYSFIGSFDGNNKIISDLKINNSANIADTGLFGSTWASAVIKNIKLINVNITGYQDTGSLIGRARGTTILNCYANGSVAGIGNVGYVGGLIGSLYSYTTGPVASNVFNSSSSVVVHGGNMNSVGGLVGESYGNIINSYSTGAVTGNNILGGLTGSSVAFWGASIVNSYSVGNVSGGSTMGGLVGYTAGGLTITTDSYWDTQTSGQLTSVLGAGLSTFQMKNISNYNQSAWNISISSLDLNNGYPYLGWQDNNYSYVWFIPSPSGLCPGNMIGSGTSGDPCQVTSWTQLNASRNNFTASYKLMNDLSASDADYNGLGNNWVPVGIFTGVYDGSSRSTVFAGSFNGNGKKIMNFTSMAVMDDYMGATINGLFGLSVGSLANLTLYVDNSNGGYYSGGLVAGSSTILGDETPRIDNCSIFVLGNISCISGGYQAGGLVGYSYGTLISNSKVILESGSNITCSEGRVGAISGNSASDTILNSYGIIKPSAVLSASGGSGLFGVSSSGSLVNTYITIENSTHGNITFFNADLIVGGNFLSYFTFGNNYVASSTALGARANIAFINMPQNFIRPKILKNGLPCRSACYNFTSLNAATVVFNVTGWSNYTIGDLNTSSNITNVSVLNKNGVPGGVILREENMGINVTIDDLEGDTSNVWVTVWQNTINGNKILSRNLSNIVGNLWNISFVTNLTFNIGLVNYTVYSRDLDGLNAQVNGSFTITQGASVSNCTTLATAGTTYVLQNDINTTGTCFTISADNITLDGNGHSITGSGGGYPLAGVIGGNPGVSNINNLTIRNFKGINGFWSGLYLAISNSIVINNTFYNNTEGVYLYGINSIVTGNIVNHSVNKGMLFVTNNFTISYNVVQGQISPGVSPSPTGIMMDDTNYNSTLINNQVFGNSQAISNDGSSGNQGVSLVYNASLVEVRWFYSGFDGRAFSVLSNLTFPGTINITGNAISIDASLLGDQFSTQLNFAANITLKEGYHGEYPVMLRKMKKGGVTCNGASGCTNVTSMGASNLVVQVTGFVAGQAYQFGKIIDSQDNATLKTGWNMISLKMQGNTSGDRNISISAGWNLIGLATDSEVDPTTMTFTNRSGNRTTFNEAARYKKLQKYISYMNNSSGKNKYAFVGKSGFDTKLVKGQGYWVYANESGNLTIPNSGGSLSNETYQLSDLMFRNSSGSELNVSDAVVAGWLSSTGDIVYWDPTANSGRGDYDYIDSPSNTNRLENIINSWEGLFIKGLKDDIKVLRQN